MTASNDELREPVRSFTFPRHTLVSLLAFAVFWEVLSHLAPALGIPPFAIPSLVRIGKSILTITPIDIVVTLARVIGALIASFVIGLTLAFSRRDADVDLLRFPLCWAGVLLALDGAGRLRHGASALPTARSDTPSDQPAAQTQLRDWPRAGWRPAAGPAR